MKWRAKPKPKIGDVRFIEKYAILPIRIGDYRVWLERVRIKQEYKRSTYETVDGLFFSDNWHTTEITNVKK